MVQRYGRVASSGALHAGTLRSEWECENFCVQKCANNSVFRLTPSVETSVSQKPILPNAIAGDQPVPFIFAYSIASNSWQNMVLSTFFQLPPQLPVTRLPVFRVRRGLRRLQRQSHSGLWRNDDGDHGNRQLHPVQ